MTDSGRVWAAVMLAGLTLCVAAIYAARVSRTSPPTKRVESEAGAESVPMGAWAAGEGGDVLSRFADSPEEPSELTGLGISEFPGLEDSELPALEDSEPPALDDGVEADGTSFMARSPSVDASGKDGCNDLHWDVAICGARWTSLRPGLSHRKLTTSGVAYQILRVDLEHHALVVADARRKGRTMATVEELARETGAVAAINGTFFDEHDRPLGWLVSDGEELNPFRNISWWAALAVTDDNGSPRADVLPHASLASMTEAERASVRFALQVGPRTVVHRRAIRLKRQHAARAAACVHVDGSVLLLVSQGMPVESNTLSKLMAAKEVDGGIECQHGLMLDGGPSAQLFVETADFRLHVRGGWPVPNAIAVVPREVMAQGGAATGGLR